jgi:5-(aminomethyl)-3-furanmethanol phosphate kinase
MSLTVIKVGGSLQKGNHLVSICQQLGSIGKSRRILIIPGGGIFADEIRVICTKYNIDQNTAHLMAILAMNQYGYLLSSLIPESRTVENTDEAKKYLDRLVPVVLLPYLTIKTIDPLPHSWDVTSDSIAAWIAGYLGAERLVLLKSTDIPYENGKDRDYRSSVDIEMLKNKDIVDPMFYTIMEKIKMLSKDNSLSSFPRKRESNDQPIPWIPAFPPSVAALLRRTGAGMTNKENKSNLVQPPEIGLWIVNGNSPEQLTSLFVI